MEIEACRGRKLVEAVKVLQIAAVEPKSELFRKPDNAEFWRQSDEAQVAELTNRVQPMYPRVARLRRQRGRVSFYVVIDQGGSLSRIALTRRTTPLLDTAATDAVRQWHYRPAMCGTGPIRVETAIYVDFHLDQQRPHPRSNIRRTRAKKVCPLAYANLALFATICKVCPRVMERHATEIESDHEENIKKTCIPPATAEIVG